MLTLIVTGKLKEPFYRQACAEYEKRLKAYGGIQIIELPEVHLPDNPSRAQIDAALKKEADAVRQKLPKNAWLCIFTPGSSYPPSSWRRSWIRCDWAENPSWYS